MPRHSKTVIRGFRRSCPLVFCEPAQPAIGITGRARSMEAGYSIELNESFSLMEFDAHSRIDGTGRIRTVSPRNAGPQLME